MKGVTAQDVKVRITTTLGNLIESGFFRVEVYDCKDFITVPTVMADYSVITAYPSSLGVMFGGFTTSNPTNCPLTSVTLVQYPGPTGFTSSCATLNGATG